MYCSLSMRPFLLIALLICSALAAAGEAASKPPQSPSAQEDAGTIIVSADAPSASDEDFLAIHEAFRLGDEAQIERLAPRFTRSLLEPYVAYYRLRTRLDSTDIADIRQFLARPADTPIIDRLRGEWLKLLGKNQQWDAFREEYPRLINADDELTCYALQARVRAAERTALVETRRLWFGNAALPENCVPLFDAAFAAGVITDEEALQLIRMELETGNVSLAGQLSARLTSRYAPAVLTLNKAYNNPARYLAGARLEKASAPERRVALFALQRLAKQSPQLAFARWEKIAAYFPETEQRYFYGWLAYEAARAQDRRALQWYKEAENAPLTPPQIAWRVRAALRKADWNEVLTSINFMEPQQQREKAWRYWKARALKALGRQDDAQAMLTALSGDYGYYSQLATDELDTQAATAPASHQPDQVEIDEVLAQPGIQRALALYRMELDAEASKEWAWAIRQYNDRELLAAAEIAHRNGIHERAIDTAERTLLLHDFNLRYPAPYRSELQEHIRDNNLEEAWVYGLMRQESRFTPHAKSNAGAAGLMQIMPTTARWAAHRLGMKGYRTALIHELEINLKIGTYYLKTVLSQFDNNPVLASAAYNAGPARAQQWRGDVPLEGAIYIETIPFDETRDYVKKVMSNTVYYSRLFGQPAASLKQRLGIIAPRNTPNRVAIADVP
jgi:soluble lytic murein transglycosylase